MTHAFVLAFPDSEKIMQSAGEISDGFSVRHFSESAVCWSRTPINNAFINMQETEDYVVVSIGKCYGGNAICQSLLDVIESGQTLDQFIIGGFGQFCLVLFNKTTKELTLISDPAGVRSLFYIRSNQKFYIGSSLGVLKDVLGNQLLLRDSDSEQFLFRYAFLPPGKTVYKGVTELLPNQKLVLKSGVEGEFKPVALPPASAVVEQSHGSHTEQLATLLMTICQQQIGQARRVGVLLGGFDSALVASMLARLGVEVETFSFRYQQTQYNQPHVEQLADYLSIRHNWIDIDASVIQQGLKHYAAHCNAPTVWPNYIIQTQYLCSIMARRGFDACLSGDGCDTAFMGYPSTHRRGGVYQRLPQLPAWLVDLLISALNALGLEYLFGHVYRVVISLLRACVYPVEQRPLHSFQLFDPCSYQRLTGESSRDDFSELFAALEQKIEKLTYPRKMYFGKSLFSPNRVKLVSSSDISGFVIDSPYMHPQLKAFAQQLPDELLRPQTGGLKEGKYLLMKMAEEGEFLPPSIIYQDKLAAIKSPVDSWYDSELAGFIKSQCLFLPFNCNNKYVESLTKDLWVEKIYKNYFSDDSVVSLAISMLMTYASYFEKN
jgi:hypothetical protein